MRFLLDTNTISELFRLQPNSSIATKYARNIDDIAIASVTWHEILYGFHRLPTSRRKEELGFFLRQIIRPNVSILDYGDDEAEWFASERARLTRMGRMPSYADGQIAAIAENLALKIVCFGHIGNGNVHVNILYDKEDKSETERANTAMSQVFTCTVQLGGQLSGEHGIGIAKRDFTTQAIDAPTLDLMRSIKSCMDPLGILNPGKVLPYEPSFIRT